MAIFKLHSASKSFGQKKVLDQVSLLLQTGEIIGIFGRNGCGKSTLLKMIFGTLPADSINMTIDDIPFSPLHNISAKQIAYLPQHSFTPQNIKVRDLIPIYFSEEEKQDAIFYDPLIANLAAQKVNTLSLGQRRYFEVLLLANLDHPFLMLDEPFSMIEPLYKVEIKKYLVHLKKKKGILITDHYYDDVLEITDKNYLIKDGKINPIASKESLRQMEYLSKDSL